jgi:carboxyl-terminal processing protease
VITHRLAFPVLLLTFVAAFSSAQSELTPETITLDQVVEDFDATWTLVSESFYGFQDATLDELREEVRPAIESAETPAEAYEFLVAMIEQLGSPTTAVIPPWEVPPPREDDGGDIELEYGGVGILLSQTQAGEILVLQVFRETPAEESGALIGDIIVGVNDWRVEGENAMEEVVSRVRGVVGTPVDLTMRDPDGAERTITVVRDQIDLTPSVEARVLENGTGYMRLPVLSADLIDEASRSLPTLLGSRNLVLDLRGVSAGTIDAMVTLGQWFLGSAQLGGFLTSEGAQGLPFRDDAIAVYQRPMVVLTNSGTAGVPEMLANALRAYRRAGLVGGQTAGGIELSRVEELPSGGLLQIAYARYVTPEGRLAPVVGMEPDVAVELPELATLRQGRDVYLEAATEALQSNPRW